MSIGRPRGSHTRYGHALRRVPLSEGLAIERRMLRGLRAARESVDVSADEIAAALGVWRETVMDWEAGRINPRLRHLTRYAAALGMSLASLLEDP